MKQVCTNIPKWKYLSGISKEQRLKDLEEEAALKAQQLLELDVVVDAPSAINDFEQEEQGEIIATA